MPDLWRELRKDFPITKTCTYLDHASAGPIPLPVAEKIQQYYHEHVYEADRGWPIWMQRREEVREKVAKFIGATPEEIAFTSGTSHSMALVAEMLAGEGAVLTNTSEFPASTIPWLWRKAKMIWQEPEHYEIKLSTLEKLLDPSVKTIVSSFVQYATGFRQDLKALGKIKGDRYLVVNATQGFGVLPVSVRESSANFLCANAHKWLMSSYGFGILYINRKALERFRPEAAGWRSMNAPDRMDNRALDMKPRASRHELGCPTFSSIFAFGAAVDYLSQIGMEKIAARVLELTDFAIAGLEKKGFEVISPRERKHRSGIVVFKVKDAERVRAKLYAEKIYVSARGEGIRIAPHFYNTEEEIERFLQKLV